MSQRRRKKFRQKDRERILLWCERHCCLCGKPCGIFMEIHHIEDRSDNRIENAMPLCFDCHGKVGHYDPDNPKGNKYSPAELKARRDQVYEKHTRYLVPPVTAHVQLRKETDKKPGMLGTDVRLVISNAGVVWAKVKVFATAIRRGRRYAIEGSYCNGDWPWYLNAQQGIDGHFTYPVRHDDRDTDDKPRVRIDLVVIDQYEREHDLLPSEYVYRGGAAWVLETCPIHERPKGD